MSVLVVSTSLNPDSRSRVLAHHVHSEFVARSLPAGFLDLVDRPLPLCDGKRCYEDPAVIDVAARVRAADAIVLATPIHNFDASAAARNFIEVTGHAWEEKVVAFLCAAGGHRSYMSIMGLASSLMLEYRAHIVPRFVYATRAAFVDGAVVDADVSRRLGELAHEVVAVTAALRPLRSTTHAPHGDSE
jgi:NAD(P)H-dependent FMN reductase